VYVFEKAPIGQLKFRVFLPHHHQTNESTLICWWIYWKDWWCENNNRRSCWFHVEYVVPVYVFVSFLLLPSFFGGNLPRFLSILFIQRTRSNWSISVALLEILLTVFRFFPFTTITLEQSFYCIAIYKYYIIICAIIQCNTIQYKAYFYIGTCIGRWSWTAACETRVRVCILKWVHVC
jgi:hypothetical protein